MNPSEIGDMDKIPVKKPVEPKQKAAEEGSTEGEEDAGTVDQVDDTETVLLNQEFLLDPDLTVREFLIQNGVEVLDFVRFECGENIASETS
jgi:elongation factor Ts